MARSQATGPGLGVGAGGVWQEASCCHVFLDIHGFISSRSNCQLTGARN